jgi:hypothetical protein
MKTTHRSSRASAGPDDGGAHHRSAHRKRTLKAAKAVLTDWTTIDCTIRDISETGARLVFGDAFKLPEEFRVIIVMTNSIVPVRLLWQRGLTARCGVRRAGGACADPPQAGGVSTRLCRKVFHGAELTLPALRT